MSEPLPSGTVVVLRDAPQPCGAPPSLASGSLRVGRLSSRPPCLELLLLQRRPREDEPLQEPASALLRLAARRPTQESASLPGPWVFPGGKVDAPDRRRGENAAADARRAAVREAGEEAGLVLDAEALVEISRWITPEISPKRFDAWFFATTAPAGAAIRVDGTEISDHRWIAPRDALRAHHAHSLRLAPPTFVTVTWLDEFASAAEALRVLPTRMPPPFRPRIHRLEAGACMLYPGDAGYENGGLEAAGARHRLWALAEGWRYERTG